MQYGFQELKEMAQIYSRAGAIGGASAEQIFMLMSVTQAKGLDAALVAERYYLVQGKPYLKASAIQADFISAGGKITWVERTDNAVEANFFHALGGSVNVRWTLEDARRIGRASSDTWKKYPRSMLTARVLTEGIKTVCPALTGFVLDEETDIKYICKKKSATVTEAESAETSADTSPSTPKEENPERNGKIKAVRKLCKEFFNCSTKSNFEELCENIVGKRYSNVSELSDEELDAVIACAEEKSQTPEPAEIPEAIETEAEIISTEILA